MADRLLLDTHALIWALSKPSELAGAARQAIADPASAVYISPASIYEINLKVALGKLQPPARNLLSNVQSLGVTELPLRLVHAALAGSLPFHHRDPFDRLIIAQAQLEGLTVVARDSLFGSYAVSLMAC